MQAAQTNEKIATVSEKHDSDMSQVNERISTTDQRVAQIAADTRTAQGMAARAAQQAEANSSKMAETSASVTALSSGVENALNYQLVEKADVTFATNKSALGPQEKAALSEIASKAAAMPRSLVELAGFADPVGSSTYNLALSRRRAESVQRYLVMQNVPLRAIHIVGLGEEAPPAGSEADPSRLDRSRPGLNQQSGPPGTDPVIRRRRPPRDGFAITEMTLASKFHCASVFAR